ncbi:MAG: AAA family ATPase [Gammaproteobacteria bacterium]|nr:AAA family ATPase [Gammaproteobacteria bacterium]
MKLRSVEIENFRAIKYLKLSLDESLTVFHGDNAHGKTSVLIRFTPAWPEPLKSWV